MRSLGLLIAFLVIPAVVTAEEPGTVVVGEVSGEVEVIPAAGSSSRILQPGDVVQEQDRIYTGFDSKVELRFSDGSAVVVQELTDMKVGSFRTDEGRAKTRLWLRAGELDAKVKPSAQGKNDFHIKTPTTTCSVRGTNPIVTTALGFTSVSFVTGYGDVTDDVSGVSTDTSSPGGAENDSEGGGLSSSSDLARSDSQGSRGVNGLTGAETRNGASMVPGETTVARGDVAGTSNGTGASFQSFSDGAAFDTLLPPATTTVPAPVPQTIIARNAMQGTIDAGELFRVFTIPGAALNGNPNVVQDVDITVSFSKMSTSGGSPRFNEIGMTLTNPMGVTVALIAIDTYLEGAIPFQGDVTFDQNAPVPVLTPGTPGTPFSGIFRPVGNLDEFNDGRVTGDWGLNISNQDSTATGDAPLTFTNAVLNITH